jgi:hypothetical protein
MEIVGVAGRDGLSGSPRAQDHVGIDYARRPGCCEEAPDAGGVHAVQSHNVCCRLADRTFESGFAGWVAHGLRERSRGDGDACGGLVSADEQRNDAAVVAVDGDESAGVEGHPRGSCGARLLPVVEHAVRPGSLLSRQLATGAG